MVTHHARHDHPWPWRSEKTLTIPHVRKGSRARSQTRYRNGDANASPINGTDFPSIYLGPFRDTFEMKNKPSNQQIHGPIDRFMVYSLCRQHAQTVMPFTTLCCCVLGDHLPVEAKSFGNFEATAPTVSRWSAL